jgi:hypothetical protein
MSAKIRKSRLLTSEYAVSGFARHALPVRRT